MKLFKRITALTLALVMIMSTVIAVPSQAASKKYYWVSTKEENYNYNNGAWKKASTYTNSYDKKGRIKSSSYKTGDYSWGYKYSYKSNGSTTTEYENGKKIGKSVNTNNKKGYLSKNKRYNAKGKLVSTTTYKYNSKGGCTQQKTTYKEKGKKAQVWKTSYTYKGKKYVKVISKDPWGGKSVSEYNKKGVRTKSTYTSKGYRSVDYYDSKGRTIKSESEDDISTSITTYSYDKKGNTSECVIKRTDKDTNETTTTTYTYECKYDKNGNMTQSITYENGNPYEKNVYSGYKKFKY